MRDTDTIGLVAFVLAVAFTFVGALLSRDRKRLPD
jgi:hypothetical protein